ncbi:MAG: MarR family winged helix-turn-helix transcriptional regulator [Acidimicrobiales bacterium]
MESDNLLDKAADLRRGVTRLSRRLRLERPEQGEPLLQLTVLALLRSRGPMSPGDLAGAERVQPQSLTRNFTALEAAGLVVRRPDAEDGRRSLLTITDDGRRAIREDVRQRDAWLAAAMADELSPVEQELLRLAGGLLERLAEADVTALHAPLDRTRNRTQAPVSARHTSPRTDGAPHRSRTTG